VRRAADAVTVRERRDLQHLHVAAGVFRDTVELGQHRECRRLVEAPVAVDHQVDVGADRLPDREHARDSRIDPRALLVAARREVLAAHAVERRDLDAAIALRHSALRARHATGGRAVGGRAIDVRVHRDRSARAVAEPFAERQSAILRKKVGECLFDRRQDRCADEPHRRMRKDARQLRDIGNGTPFEVARDLLEVRPLQGFPAVQRCLADAGKATVGGDAKEEPVGLCRHVEYQWLDTRDEHEQ
jgi:hypothetical protein